MHIRIAAVAALMLPVLTGHAQAQSLPNWSIAKICQHDSAPGQCRLFELRARARVAEAWLTLPDSIQKGCVAEFRPPLEPSWRVMADCIGELGVVARVNVRRSAVKREIKVVEKLRERRVRAEKAARQKAVRIAEEKRRKVAEAAEQRRVELEEKSFLATLEAERALERRRLAQAAAEKQRIEQEEKSFLATLEAERAREERQRLAAEQARQRAKELEEQRIAAEEASFLKELAAQQKQERLAREAAAKAAAAKAKESAVAQSSDSTVQPASASAAGLIGGGKASASPTPEKPKPQKTIKVTLPAQPAKKAAPQPVTKKAAAKPRAADVAVCEDRLKDTAQAGSVLFAFDSADLLEEAELTLRALSAAVRACGRLKVTIEGHTDATGRIAYNQRLSERRAQNVANFLINAGAKSEQVTYVGYGEKRPVATNRTSDGRAKNRRIEYRAQ